MPAGLPLLADVDGELARRQQAGMPRAPHADREKTPSNSCPASARARRVAHRDADPQSRLEELGRDHEPRARRRPRRSARARSRACGPVTPTSPAPPYIAMTRATFSSASARETTAVARRRSAAGSCASSASASEATSRTSATDAMPSGGMPEDINAAVDESQLRTLDADAEKRMIEKIDETAAGNTLGGICEVVADGIPVGLGSHVSWTASSMGASARRSCPSRR